MKPQPRVSFHAVAEMHPAAVANAWLECTVALESAHVPRSRLHSAGSVTEIRLKPLVGKLPMRLIREYREWHGVSRIQFLSEIRFGSGGLEVIEKFQETAHVVKT